MTSALEKVKAVAGIKPETGGYSVYEEPSRTSRRVGAAIRG